MCQWPPERRGITDPGPSLASPVNPTLLFPQSGEEMAALSSWRPRARFLGTIFLNIQPQLWLAFMGAHIAPHSHLCPGGSFSQLLSSQSMAITAPQRGKRDPLYPSAATAHVPYSWYQSDYISLKAPWLLPKASLGHSPTGPRGSRLVASLTELVTWVEHV